jgi:hypothetical protein
MALVLRVGGLCSLVRICLFEGLFARSVPWWVTRLRDLERLCDAAVMLWKLN